MDDDFEPVDVGDSEKNLVRPELLNAPKYKRSFKKPLSKPMRFVQKWTRLTLGWGLLGWGIIGLIPMVPGGFPMIFAAAPLLAPESPLARRIMARMRCHIPETSAQILEYGKSAKTVDWARLAIHRTDPVRVLKNHRSDWNPLEEPIFPSDGLSSPVKEWVAKTDGFARKTVQGADGLVLGRLMKAVGWLLKHAGKTGEQAAQHFDKTLDNVAEHSVRHSPAVLRALEPARLQGEALLQRLDSHLPALKSWRITIGKQAEQALADFHRRAVPKSGNAPKP